MAEALETPYISLADADAYNTGDTAWDAATDAEKNEALLIGRMYLDMKYISKAYFAESDAPIAVQNANALLAKEYINAPTTFFNIKDGSLIKSERSKADSVEYEVENFGSKSTDKFPFVTALVSPFLTWGGSTNFVTR